MRLTVKEEETVHATIRDLAFEVVGYFIYALADEGTDGEEGEDPSTTPEVSIDEAFDGSSTAAARQQPPVRPSSP